MTKNSLYQRYYIGFLFCRNCGILVKKGGEEVKEKRGLILCVVIAIAAFLGLFFLMVYLTEDITKVFGFVALPFLLFAAVAFTISKILEKCFPSLKESGEAIEIVAFVLILILVFFFNK